MPWVRGALRAARDRPPGRNPLLGSRGLAGRRRVPPPGLLGGRRAFGWLELSTGRRELEGLSRRADGVVVRLARRDHAGEAFASREQEIEARGRETDEAVESVLPAPLDGGRHRPQPRSWKKKPGRAPSMT